MCIFVIPAHLFKNYEGPNSGGKETTPTSSAKKPKPKEDKKEDEDKKAKEKEKEKERARQTSFPAANTTDAVRLKCRELLAGALKSDGGKF